MALKKCTLRSLSLCSLICVQAERDINADFDYSQQCQIVNYISATLYQGPDPQASITLSGGSNPQEFNCEDVLDTINDVLDQLDLPDIFGKLVSWGEIGCGAAGSRR